MIPLSILSIVFDSSKAAHPFKRVLFEALHAGTIVTRRYILSLTGAPEISLSKSKAPAKLKSCFRRTPQPGPACVPSVI
jgi:hypothetical protein